MKNTILKYLFGATLMLTSSTPILAEDKPVVAYECSESKKIKTLLAEGIQLFGNGNVEEALKKYIRATEFYEIGSCQDSSLLFSILTDISVCYSADYLNDKEQWISYLERAKKNLDETKNSPGSVVKYYIQRTYFDWYDRQRDQVLGFSNKAKDYFNGHKEEIVTELGKEKALELEASVKQWQVRSYLVTENEDGISRSHEEFSKFYKKNRNVKDIQDHYALGNFYVGRYYQTPNPFRAIDFFDMAEEVSQDENIKLYATVCKGFSLLNARAYSRIPKVISKLESFENLTPLQELNIHEIAARCYSETKSIEKLVHHSNKALTILNKKGVSIDVQNFRPEDFSPIEVYRYPILLNQFANFLEESGIENLRNTADEMYVLGLGQFADRIQGVLSENQAVNYEVIKNRTLGYLIKNQSLLKKKREILSKIEQVENQSTFNKLISNRVLSEKKGVLDSLFKLELELREQITDIRKTLENEKASENQAIFELEQRLNDIDEQIRNENPDVHKITNSLFSFDGLNLETNEKVLKFIKAEDELFKIVITKRTIEISNLNDYGLIANQVSDFLDNLKSRKEMDHLEKVSKLLYEKLIGDEALTESTRIISDGILNYLPFELLMDERGEYLINKTATSYLNGLAHLNFKKEKKENVTRTVFFAPTYESFNPSPQELAVRGEPYDLQGAQNEIKEIAKLVRGTLYRGHDASRQTFLNLPNDYSVLHMAGHAFLNGKDSQLSNLVFSDDQEDNRLYISEIYGLKSNADLVVLSACNTGVGGYGSGESVVSLSQAFMYSGVPSTVSSLWSAPDQSTKDIMVSFYKNLDQGLSKSLALQQAKLEYLKNTSNTKLKHPYYWAGFILYGSDAPLSFVKPWYGTFWGWSIFGIFTVLILVYFLRHLIFQKKQNG